MGKQLSRSSAEYEAFRRTRRWYEMRVRAFARDKNTCQACLEPKRSYQLALHHLTYDYGLDAPFFALITICRACHERLHAGRSGKVDPWDPSTHGNTRTTSSPAMGA